MFSIKILVLNSNWQNLYFSTRFYSVNLSQKIQPNRFGKPGSVKLAKSDGIIPKTLTINWNGSKKFRIGWMRSIIALRMKPRKFKGAVTTPKRPVSVQLTAAARLKNINENKFIN